MLFDPGSSPKVSAARQRVARGNEPDTTLVHATLFRRGLLLVLKERASQLRLILQVLMRPYNGKQDTVRSQAFPIAETCHAIA